MKVSGCPQSPFTDETEYSLWLQIHHNLKLVLGLSACVNWRPFYNNDSEFVECGTFSPQSSPLGHQHWSLEGHRFRMTNGFYWYRSLVQASPKLRAFHTPFPLTFLTVFFMKQMLILLPFQRWENYGLERLIVSWFHANSNEKAKLRPS